MYHRWLCDPLWQPDSASVYSNTRVCLIHFGYPDSASAYRQHQCLSDPLWLPRQCLCLQAPVKFSLAELGGTQVGKREGSVCVNARNRFYFSNTSGLVFTWRVMLGGEPLPVGEPLHLDPELWHPGGSVLIGPQVRQVPHKAVLLHQTAEEGGAIRAEREEEEFHQVQPMPG